MDALTPTAAPGIQIHLARDPAAGHEVGTLTDGLRDFMINWAPRRITDEAGQERRQPLCSEAAATQDRTFLQEIGRT